MVFDTANLQRLKTVLAGDAAHVCPEVVAEFRVDGAAAFFGREYGVMEVAGVGVSHDVSRPSGTGIVGTVYPGLKSWAIVGASVPDADDEEAFRFGKSWAIVGASVPDNGIAAFQFGKSWAMSWC
jgi:hypothetical protein